MVLLAQLLVPALCSAVGDAIPILTFLGYRQIRSGVTSRMITWFAVADLIGAVAISVALLAPEAFAVDGPMCTVQAALNWYSIWSSWGWTVAFAHTVRRCFNSVAHQDSLRLGSIDVAQMRQVEPQHA